MTTSRRQFLKSTGLAVSCLVAGKATLMSPAKAYAQALPYQTLSATEVATLEALSLIHI